MALVCKPFGDIITFTRASTATFFDSAGVLTSAAIDAPRLDYNPSTLAAQGLLIEESRTNLCLASEDFFQTGTGGVNWIWPAGVITGDTQVAPNGTVTADTCTTTGGAASIYQSITVTASTSYTFSLFVKLGTMSASDYKIAIYDNTAANFIATDVAPSQVPNTSSWTRVTYTFTTPVGCTSVRVYPFRNSATITSSTVFIWGAQLEAGAFPTSYIPTTTTALTRAADVASVNTLSPWYNATEGTLFAEFTRGYTGNFINFSSAAVITNNAIPPSTSGIASAYTNGANQQLYSSMALNNVEQLDYRAKNSQITNKVALAYKTNDTQQFINGLAEITDTSCTVPTSVSQMNIGASYVNNTFMNSWIRRITYYPRRLSQSEGIAITA